MSEGSPTEKLKGQLASEAWNAREFAYAPYSGYPVGAAVLTADGRVFSGCNIENLSYGATLCAERVAVASAVSAGVRKIAAIAIISKESEPCLPCGMCRQVLSEFCDPDTIVLACRDDRTYVEYRFGELFPHVFQSKQIYQGGSI